MTPTPNGMKICWCLSHCLAIELCVAAEAGQEIQDRGTFRSEITEIMKITRGPMLTARQARPLNGMNRVNLGPAALCNWP